jgi:hypothetical protein
MSRKPRTAVEGSERCSQKVDGLTEKLAEEIQ